MTTQDPYANVPQARKPIDDTDRAALQKNAAAGNIAGIVAMAIGLGVVGVGFGAIGGVFGVFFGVLGFAFVGVGFYIRKKTAADATATEKTVYTGLVTDKRRDVERHGQGVDSNGTSRDVLQLDGVDFTVPTGLWVNVEKGMRVELHCVNGGWPFRIERLT